MLLMPMQFDSRLSAKVERNLRIILIINHALGNPANKLYQSVQEHVWLSFETSAGLHKADTAQHSGTDGGRGIMQAVATDGRGGGK